jgi:hypothetical protein
MKYAEQMLTVASAQIIALTAISKVNSHKTAPMIEHCAQFVEEFNKDSEQKVTKEEAIAMMKQEFPKLKRWQA